MHSLYPPRLAHQVHRCPGIDIVSRIARFALPPSMSWNTRGLRTTVRPNNPPNADSPTRPHSSYHEPQNHNHNHNVCNSRNSQVRGCPWWIWMCQERCKRGESLRGGKVITHSGQMKEEYHVSIDGVEISGSRHTASMNLSSVGHGHSPIIKCYTPPGLPEKTMDRSKGTWYFKCVTWRGDNIKRSFRLF